MGPWLVVLPLALSATPAPKAPQPLEVQGHRGARAVRPENTLAAFRYALNVGVDVLEMDLGVTRDGVVVVSHDQHLNPDLCQDKAGRAPPKKPIVELMFAEIRKFDCGSKKNPRFPRQQLVPGERIPKLSEVFDLVKKHKDGARVRFNLETKINPGYPEQSLPPGPFVEAVYTAIKKSGLQKRISIQSFDYRTLALFAKRAPNIERVVLVSDSLQDPVAVARAVGAQVYSCHHRWITKADVERLHKANVRVIPWTANSVTDFERLMKLGVDGIITDDPALLLKHLGRHP